MKKKRCSFEDEDGRCKRLGEGTPPLCPDHDEVEFDEEYEYAPLVDTIISNPRIDKLVGKAGGILDALAGLIDRAGQVGDKGTVPPKAGARPAPRPPRVAPADDPRTVLHFGSKDVLTREIIKKRHVALAQMIHPDHVGGSDEAMRKLNVARDQLLKEVK